MAQVLGFGESQKSALNLSASLLQTEYKQSDNESGAASSMLPQLGFGYALHFGNKSEMHLTAEVASRDSRLINLTEHVLFKMAGGQKNTLRGGLGIYYINYLPIEDRPGFRNLGGFGFVLQIDTSRLGMILQGGALFNSDTVNFASYFDSSIYFRIKSWEQKRTLYLKVGYSKTTQKGKSSNIVSTLAGEKFGLVYEFP